MAGNPWRGAARRAVLAALADCRGATAVEYGLLGAGIVVAIIAALFAVGDEIVILFSNVQGSFADKQPGG